MAIAAACKGLEGELCTTLIFGQFWSLRGASEPLAASKAWLDVASCGLSMCYEIASLRPQ